MLLKFPCQFLAQDKMDYEGLGLPRPETPELEVADIYIFKDKICSFNEHTEKGLITIRTSDGYTFVVEETIKNLLRKMQEDAE